MEINSLFKELLPKIEQRLDKLIPDNGEKYSAAKKMTWDLQIPIRQATPPLPLQ